MDKEKYLLEYQAGKQALENGQYRSSIEHLQRAISLVPNNSRWGGKAQIWLVTAYQAATMLEEAVALCQQLTSHPDLETRKQAKRLLYIIEAPRLKRPKEWMSEIPDLTQVSESENKYVSQRNKENNFTQKNNIKEPIDLSQVETEDNNFFLVALLLVGLLFLGLFLFNFN